MADAVGQLGAGQADLFIDLSGLFLFQMLCRRLHLDDVRAEKRCHMRGIGGYIKRRLTGL